MKRSCENCKNRCWHSWSGLDYCMAYEMASSEAEYEKEAADCPRYELEVPEERYTSSATAGDYGPSCPWKAPGMSVKDFI